MQKRFYSPVCRVVEYSYENNLLEEVLEQVKAALAGPGGGRVDKVSSVALVLHSSERELFVCQVVQGRF